MATSSDEKLENTDFDLFKALEALDKKDYGYWDRLTTEQQRKFLPYMLLQWLSSVDGSADLQRYYLNSVDYCANKHLFNEAVQRHPKLQWLMMCSSSPGLGKQRHQWIPQVNKKVAKNEERAKIRDIKDYYAKIYRSASSQDIAELANIYVNTQHKKVYLAEKYPEMKQSDIDTLSKIITEKDIETYEKDIGN